MAISTRFGGSTWGPIRSAPSSRCGWSGFERSRVRPQPLPFLEGKNPALTILQTGPPSRLGLRGEIITDFSRLETLAGTWERLRRAGRRPEVFQTFPWARASWQARGIGVTLAAVVVYDSAEPVGLLPLALEGRTLRFLAAPG